MYVMITDFHRFFKYWFQLDDIALSKVPRIHGPVCVVRCVAFITMTCLLNVVSHVIKWLITNLMLLYDTTQHSQIAVDVSFMFILCSDVTTATARMTVALSLC